MAPQPRPSKHSPQLAARSRDRALIRVRRATVGIGVAASAGAIGLGVLVASGTTDPLLVGGHHFDDIGPDRHGTVDHLCHGIHRLRPVLGLDRDGLLRGHDANHHHPAVDQ